MTAHAQTRRFRQLRDAMHAHGFAQKVIRTAGFNVGAAAAAGLGGVIIARAVGPGVRGEYAAVTSWFGLALMVGGVGQPAALCFYVARDPERARDYVATSRAMMIVTGAIALTAGFLLAPLLSHGVPAVVAGYRIAFSASIMAFVGASYTFSLQAKDIRQWNLVRITQPVLALIAIVVLWRLRLLTLDSSLLILAGTMSLQLAWAYFACHRTGLLAGRVSVGLVKPLFTYGAAQIAALTPALVNADLDQLVLSQTVPPAALGKYAIAVTLTLLPIPLVSAIGNVAFPRLAAQREVTGATRRLQRAAVLGSGGVAAAILIPIAALSYWAVPLVFGTAYRGAVPMVWILTPGSVFLSCSQVVGDLLRGRSHPAVVAWAQGLAAIFTVVLLLALLPVIGVYGAAVASTISYGVALAAMLRRLWRLPRHARGSYSAAPVRASAQPET